jgi:hypothetical protein
LSTPEHLLDFGGRVANASTAAQVPSLVPGHLINGGLPAWRDLDHAECVPKSSGSRVTEQVRGGSTVHKTSCRAGDHDPETDAVAQLTRIPGASVSVGRSVVELVAGPGMWMDVGEFEIRLLGPFDVRQRGRPAGPAGSKRRGLLALLALRAGRVVPVGELIDGLWGETAPASAANLVQTYVSAWRKALEADRAGRGGSGRMTSGQYPHSPKGQYTLWI